jgi:hypothetical protein
MVIYYLGVYSLPVNAARGVFMKAKESCIIGHVHKVSEHQETDIDGKGNGNLFHWLFM